MTKKNATNRKKTSPIWIYPENDFINLINNSKRMKDVLSTLGVANKGGNFNTVNARIAQLGLNKDHMVGMRESSIIGRTITIDEFKSEWLVKSSKRQRTTLKRYLLKFGLIKWECNYCGNKGDWHGRKLTLQLEHKNGVSNDNRIENLCLLCPNCHSQTSTYAGKNCRART